MIENSQNRIIWVMWWQGEQSMPSIVQACVKSIKKYGNGAEVKIIDKDNYMQYIEISPYIIQKFENSCFSITHLSDIIRFQLLYEYGGIWIDATVLLTETIPDECFDLELFTIKRKINPIKSTGNVARGRWTAFLVGGHKKNKFFEMMNTLFDNYWKNESSLVCYFLIDYYWDMLFEKYDFVRKMWDKIPYYAYNIFKLERKLNEAYAENEIFQMGLFHKLSWKNNYNLEYREKPTFFAWIVKEYELDTKQIILQNYETTKKINNRREILKLWISKERIKTFGIGVCVISLISAYTMNKQGKMYRFWDKLYDKVMYRYLDTYMAVFRKRK